MIKIESKTEFGAHEICADDFDVEGKRPEIRGVVWREPTRTVRLTSQSEIDDDGEEDDSPEEDERPPRRRFRDSSRPLSFYGIGCFIIVKNGKAIGLMSPKAFNARFRSVE